jgi:uncharacterized damage-inducible protein DinB
MKHGRSRVFHGIGDMESELAHLDELRKRSLDLIEDIPSADRSTERIGHSLNGLFLHMFEAEVKWVSFVSDVEIVSGSNDIGVLDIYTRRSLSGCGLNDIFNGPRFDDIGQMLRHLHWHWSYHSAQMGLLRREIGFRYKWN